MTGIGPDTLRAWERRYSAVKPARQGRGRAYSEEDVERLRLLRDLQERGYAIGEIAQMDRTKLLELKAAADGKPKTKTEPQQPHLEKIHSMLERFALADFERELRRLALALPASQWVQEVLLPLETESDEWGTARRNALRWAARSLLSEMTRGGANGHTPRVLVATPDPEGREAGAIGAAMLAAAEGFDPVLLGAGMRGEEVAQAVERICPKVLVVTVFERSGLERTAREINDAIRDLNGDTEVLLCGAVTPLRTMLPSRKLSYLNDLDSLRARLRELREKR
jgi:DNA-binding transcriptional MerR regulator/methylmalonyl-CoA mutase cobalamin-binding subunit